MRCKHCGAELPLDEAFYTLLGEKVVMCNRCGEVRFLGWEREKEV